MASNLIVAGFLVMICSYFLLVSLKYLANSKVIT